MTFFTTADVDLATFSDDKLGEAATGVWSSPSSMTLLLLTTGMSLRSKVTTTGLVGDEGRVGGADMLPSFTEFTIDSKTCGCCCLLLLPMFNPAFWSIDDWQVFIIFFFRLTTPGGSFDVSASVVAFILMLFGDEFIVFWLLAVDDGVLDFIGETAGVDGDFFLTTTAGGVCLTIVVDLTTGLTDSEAHVCLFVWCPLVIKCCPENKTSFKNS